MAASLAGGGEMGALMRGLDWSATALGPAEQWPQSLHTAIGICLNSRFALLIWWGPDLTMLYNDAYRQIIAGKHPAALGRPGRECWREIWHIVGPMLEGVITTGEPTWSDDLLLMLERHGYAEECYFTFSYSPIRGDDGDIAGVFTPVQETTEKVIGARRLWTLRDLAARAGEAQTTEGALATAAATLEANPHDIPFALIYTLEGEGRARLAGAAGIARGGPASPEIVNLGDRGGWPLEHVAHRGEPLLVEDLGRRFGELPRGAWAIPPHSATLLPLTLPGHESPAAILIAAVSPHKALDEQYRSFYNLAAGHVAAALAEARAFEEERRRAESLAELDRAKSTFFSNISHEFRTPLTLLLGPLEDAMAGGGVDAEWLEPAYRNGRRLLKMVNTLLDFSRLEAGRVRPEPVPTDPGVLTAGIAAHFHSAVERAGLKFTVDCPSTRMLLLDRDMWEKIVVNLLSNALKFTFEGEIAVSLRVRRGRAELAVRDTGTGIPATEMDKLFVRFHRVASARGRTHEGTGIGLALVRELVELHGGTVSAESELGRGSIFRVSIPCEAAEGAPAVPLPKSALAPLYAEEAISWLVSDDHRAAAPPRPGGARPRVLLADDNADMREHLRRILEPEYEVVAVRDGNAAVTCALETAPDAVLADVMMPECDGFEMLGRLRSDARTAALPVVLLSARAGEQSRIEGLEAGADDYLVKPFSGRELRARLRALLEVARLRRDALMREQALRAEGESERARTARLLENLDEAFVSFDAGCRCTLVNRKAVDLARKPAEELIGKVVWDVFPGLAGGAFYRHVHAVLRDRRPAHFSEWLPERERWVEVDAYPLEGGVGVLVRDITGRKRAERELAQRYTQLECLYGTAEAVGKARALDEIYRTAVDGLRRAIGVERVSVLAFDPDGVMRFKAWHGLSEAYRRRVEGHTPWRPDSHDARTLLVPDVAEDTELAPYREVFAAERIRGLAFIPLLGGSGVLGKFMLYYAEPYRVRDDELRVAETIANHVAFATERRLAEEAVRESKARAENILDSITESFIALDREFRFTYANNRVYERMGKRPEEVLGRNIWEVAPLAAATSFRAEYERVMRERVPSRFEVKYPTGEWYEVHAQPTAEGLSAYILDITASKRAQEELEAYYKTAPVGLCLFDRDLRYMRINEHLAAMHGAPAEAHVGKRLADMVPGLAPALEPLYRAVLETGRPLEQREIEGPTSSGNSSERVWLVSLFPVGGEGGVTGVSSVVQDITERKRFENQMRETQKLEAIGVLAGGIAHDFNNLLTGILGNASLIAEETPADSPLQESLQDLIRASERAADLTGQLLAYSGKGRYAIQPVDLPALILETRSLVRASIPRNVNLQFDLDDRVPPVEGDRTQIQQLLMNLLINAAEAIGPERPGTVTVSAASVHYDGAGLETAIGGRELKAGEYVCTTVRDDGDGMDEATRLRIFDPFFTTKFTGRGLGLAATLGIVRAHAGAIAVESYPGHGSVFRVFFPAGRGVGAPLQENGGERVAGAGTILVVDDEELVNRVARSALERNGYRILAAENGREAIRIFAASPEAIDLVVLDLTMPEMGGAETLEKLRAIRPEVPVLVSSGHSEQDVRSRFQGVAVSGFVQKPYRAAELTRRVHEALRRQAAPGPRDA